jgi:hypothetical protein
MSAFFALLVVATWVGTVVLAYGSGWVKGHDTSEANHKWNRWLLRKYENRSVRF